jgi:hypothetical protein
MSPGEVLLKPLVVVVLMYGTHMTLGQILASIQFRIQRRKGKLKCDPLVRLDFAHIPFLPVSRYFLGQI